MGLNHDASLEVYGFGVYLPRKIRIVEKILAEGGDAAVHEANMATGRDWKYICVASGDDHPSTMGHKALAAAMKDAGIGAQDLGLIICVSASRDYLPIWSVSTEIGRLAGVSPDCLGMDLSNGCLGSLVALEILRGWFAANSNGKFAAIVATERWTESVSHKNLDSGAFWTWSDGACAMIAGPTGANKSKATFRGGLFHTDSRYHDACVMKYGGTRFPLEPDGKRSFHAKAPHIDISELREDYVKSVLLVISKIRDEFKIDADYYVCNQPRPGNLHKIAGKLNVPMSKVSYTGERFGHLGAGDVILGLKELIESRAEHPGVNNVYCAATTSYGWGCGLIQLPSE